VRRFSGEIVGVLRRVGEEALEHCGALQVLPVCIAMQEVNRIWVPGVSVSIT
jgi:hypothetical protein